MRHEDIDEIIENIQLPHISNLETREAKLLTLTFARLIVNLRIEVYNRFFEKEQGNES